MRFSTRFLPFLLAVALAEPEPDPQNVDASRLIQQFDPSATITSISPAQSSALASNIPAYITAFTASNPPATLAGAIAVDAVVGTQPAPGVISSANALLANAPSALAADPSAYLASLNALVSPYGFASDVYAYESKLVDGLRTVVASDLSLSLPSPTPTPTSASSAGAGNEGPRPTGAAVVAAAGAAAAVAGLMAL